MMQRSRSADAWIVGVWLCLALTLSGWSQIGQPAYADRAKEKVVTSHAHGTFEVKITPLPADNGADPSLAPMSIDKQIHGDLEATSKGQMISTMNREVGSGGYVALERVTGTLKGRTGSFVLQHSGTMTRNVPQLSVTVVPDSGTDQIAGLTGTFTIKIDAGKHSYDFEYTLPESP